MKGMLVKDIRLMVNQGRILFATLILVAVFLGFIDNGGASFVVAYITFVCAMFTVTTISYDEFDNGALFLLSLPVTRKLYVNEKYIFGGIVSCISWCFAMLAGAAVLLITGKKLDFGEWTGTGVIYLFFAWIFLSVLVPLRLKFDVEKARYVNMIVVGSLLALGFAVGGVYKMLPQPLRMEIMDKLIRIGNLQFIFLTAAASVIFIIVSYICSRRIMKSKEF